MYWNKLFSVNTFVSWTWKRILKWQKKYDGNLLGNLAKMCCIHFAKLDVSFTFWRVGECNWNTGWLFLEYEDERVLSLCVLSMWRVYFNCFRRSFSTMSRWILQLVSATIAPCFSCSPCSWSPRRHFSSTMQSLMPWSVATIGPYSRDTSFDIHNQ